MAKELATENVRRNPSSGAHNERLSAVEVDVRHLDQRIEHLGHEVSEGFSSLRRMMSEQRQPITAFAGWASVILALVYAFGSPLAETDTRHQHRIDQLMTRELKDAETRGKYEERFVTLKSEIHQAVENRKDIDAKHIAAQNRLKEDIEEVRHSLDNGLGRRINEINAPLIERMIALERQQFSTSPNERDMDRK